jgi:thiol-disulfide isomerase/thioredoxin
MKNVIKHLLLLACGLALTTTTFAAGQLGDSAAPLQISEWTKGKPVNLAALKGKQVAVVEFWATWCPPCRASIPHLTELQKKFKDVVFIGVSDEESAVVKKFVTKMGAQMDYTVALDQNRQTSAGYMGAYKIGGIPHAFIVDKQGRVVWHGHPMDRLEETLDQVVKGTYDMGKEKKRADAQIQLQEFMELAANSTDEAEVKKAGEAIEALDREVGGIEAGQKFNAAEIIKSVKFRQALQKYQMAVTRTQNAATLATFEKQVVELAPEGFKLEEFKQEMKMRQTMSAYMMAVTGQGDTNNLPELSKAMATLDIKDGNTLNRIAWILLTEDAVKLRDLDLIEQLAKKSVALSEEKDAQAMDTYARALFAAGKHQEAVQWQKKAIDANTDEGMKADLTDALKTYEGKLTAAK